MKLTGIVLCLVCTGEMFGRSTEFVGDVSGMSNARLEVHTAFFRGRLGINLLITPLNLSLLVVQ